MAKVQWRKRDAGFSATPMSVGVCACFVCTLLILLGFPAYSCHLGFSFMCAAALPLQRGQRQRLCAPPLPGAL